MKKYNLVFQIFLIFLVLIQMSYILFSMGSNRVTQKIDINQDKSKILSKITTDIQLEYLKSYLGEPAIINYSKDRTQIEYIFVDPDYYLQVITNSDNKVNAYAITTRIEDFSSILFLNNQQFQLGNTTYFTEGSKPVNCLSFVGNTAPSYYYERYSGWNGTGYRDYLLGYNDAGYGEGTIVLASQDNLTNTTVHDEDDEIYEGIQCSIPQDDIRKKETINTLIVLMPGFESSFGLGVDRKKMSNLNE